MHSWRVHAASGMVMWVMMDVGGGGGALGEEVWRAGDVEAHRYLLDGRPRIGPIVEAVGRGCWWTVLCGRRVHESVLSMKSLSACEDGRGVGYALAALARVSWECCRRTCASNA